ncbi:MAG: hypothetical protein M3494_11685 [Actinomycetota bacterium]|jgi:hypothetical protein|nr:hypothetical protein [Rubrobacter sp.]MDQ3508656.1 hypothetical protein [Actinomycetota bacterium]
MTESISYVVILGGPEPEPELLAIVFDDGQAIPLFDSTEEAEEFLESTGDFGREWYAIEMSAGDLASLLAHQSEEVRHIAISPPPEDMAGGMEIQVLDIETFTVLLERQAEVAEEPEEKPKRGFLRRLFGR